VGILMEVKDRGAVRASSPLQVNVAVASAITAYARVVLYPHRKDAIYTDTDSIVISSSALGRAPNDIAPIISNNLGDFKIESVIAAFLAIADKRYGFVCMDNAEIVKFRGLPRGSMTLDELYSL